MVMYPRIWKALGFLTTFDHNFDQNGGESGRKYRNIRTVCGGKSEKNGLKRAITSQKREFWTFGSMRPQVRILSLRPYRVFIAKVMNARYFFAHIGLLGAGILLFLLCRSGQTVDRYTLRTQQ